MDLPDELILSILQYLDPKSARMMRDVSANMFRIATDRSLVEIFTRNVHKDDNPLAKMAIMIGPTMMENYLKMYPPTKGDRILFTACYEQKYTRSNKIKEYYHKMITLFIKYGADPNDSAPHGLPLTQALKIKDNDVTVLLLLTAGADPNLVPNVFTNYLYTQFTTDKVKDYRYHIIDYFTMLLEHGLSPNKKREKHSPLKTILQKGDVDHGQRCWKLLKMLLRIGANPNLKFHGIYPLTTFFKNAHKWVEPLKVLHLLLKAGANPTLPTGTNSPTFILCVKGYWQWENPLQVIRFLIDTYGLSIQFTLDYRNRYGGAGIMGAGWQKKYYILDPCQLNTLKNKGTLPSDTVHKNRYDIISMLLENGMDFGVLNSLLSEFPLHWAVKYRQPDLVRLFLYHGADVNRTDGQGNTPLHLIKMCRKIDVVSTDALLNRENGKLIINMLLQIGANPEIKNDMDESAKELVIHFLKCDCMYQKLI